MWTPELATAFVLGAALGAVIVLALTQSRPSDGSPEPIPDPLPEKEYQSKLEASKNGYLEAMAQYDRLLPWASGGALVVSLTFVSSFARVAPPWTKWILGAAWLALVASLVSSILSQYSSTRIKVAAMQYLTAVQTPPNSRSSRRDKDEWTTRVLALESKSRDRARDTRLLNEFAGLMLLFGLISLGAFALLAVPFGKAAHHAWAFSLAA